jgi:glyoxylase-like metal-dependent hydrolase (beta-lactamase superfamily II)
MAGGMNAWGRHYEAIEIETDALPATVLQYDRVASGCLGYLVVAGDEAAVIDPLRAFADRYVADARERDAELRYAIDTHVHADHVSGVRAVAEASAAEPVLPEGAAERGLAFEPRLVADGESLTLGETKLRARALPGHTSEMTGFALGGDDHRSEAPLWFTGDTVFPNAVARPDLEVEADSSADTEAAGAEEVRSAARQLHRTITERLGSLPEETVLAPGHRQQLRADPSLLTVGDLDRFDVLELASEAFADRIADRMGPQPANFRQLVAINLGRESLAEDAELELELGPNNCAVG